MKKPVAMVCFSGLILLLTLVFPGCGERNETPVFPDDNLERSIRKATNQPEGDISRAKLENLVKLDLRQLLIQDLTGIELCINLVELNLETNEITDLTPISSLKKLEILNLSFNPISDLSLLAGCYRLRNLFLFQCGIKDLHGLEDMVTLTILDLGNNSISDITPLSNLRSLRILNLSQFIFDRGFSLRQIRRIEEGDYVSFLDISPLANLGNLTELYLEFYFIEDVSYLAALTDLEKLSLKYNNIADTSPLTGLKNLLDLRLDYNPITDLEAWIDYIPGDGRFLRIHLKDCPLDETSVTTYIPLMQEAGIKVVR